MDNIESATYSTCEKCVNEGIMLCEVVPDSCEIYKKLYMLDNTKFNISHIKDTVKEVPICKEKT